MQTRGHITNVSDRKQGCPHVLFAEDAGIFWLRGDNLSRVKKAIGLSSDDKAIGFDGETASIYIDELMGKGITVGIVRGNTIRTLICQQTRKPEKVKSKTIWLAPTLIFGQKELSSMKQCPDSEQLKEFGSLYVYQLSEDLYEIDWDLTSIPKTTVEALALTAHLKGELLCCELVPPKPKRIGGNQRMREIGAGFKAQFVVSEPQAYGQLRMEI